MVWEVLEAALTYNATRWRPNVLTLRFEEIPRGFDGARQRALDGRAPTLRRPSAIHLKTSLERQMSSSRVTV